MKILLLFVPEFSSCDLPYLSLPCLTAYMKSRGYDVEQRDLNVEFMNYFLSSEGVYDLKAMAQDRLARLNALPHLNALEQRAYAKLAWAALTPSEEILKQAAWAKRVFKSEAFYSLKQYNKAKRMLDRWRNMLEGVLVAPGEMVPPGIYRYHDSSEMLIRVVETPNRNPFEKFFQMVLPSIKALQPDLIGISLVVPSQILPVLTLGKLLKEALPTVPVVVGGNICTRLADVLPHSPNLFQYFDMVVVKEGEKPLAALAEQIATGCRDWSRVPNLIYTRDGTLHANPVEEPEDIDVLPTPDFDGLPLNEYLSPRLALPLYSCKGCYWGRCAFCNIHMGYARFRARNPQLVLRDMAFLHDRYGAEIINFVDEAMPYQNLVAIADGMVEMGLDVEWNTHARMEHFFTPELCAKLHRGKCTALYFGLEAGNRRIHSLMRRGIDLANAPHVLQTVHDAGIITHVNVILGFPGETEAETEDSINFLFRNKEHIDSVYATPFVMGRWAPIAQAPDQWGVTISPVQGCDLALFYQEYQEPVGGLTSRQADELKWKVQERFNRAYPYFGLKNFEEALPYAVRHFGTTDRMELLSLSNFEQKAAAGPEQDGGDVIRLTDGVLLLTLAHDFPRIRQLLAYPLERPIVLEAAPAHILYDVSQDRIFKLSRMQYRILSVMIGKSPPDAEVAVAQELRVATGQAALFMRALCRLVREMIHVPQTWLEVNA